jgi:hypothetical protein
LITLGATYVILSTQQMRVRGEFYPDENSIRPIHNQFKQIELSVMKYKYQTIGVFLHRQITERSRLHVLVLGWSHEQLAHKELSWFKLLLRGNSSTSN